MKRGTIKYEHAATILDAALFAADPLHMGTREALLWGASLLTDAANRMEQGRCMLTGKPIGHPNAK